MNRWVGCFVEKDIYFIYFDKNSDAISVHFNSPNFQAQIIKLERINAHLGVIFDLGLNEMCDRMRYWMEIFISNNIFSFSHLSPFL